MKRKNPLYVVSEKGKTVEKTQSYLEVWMGQLGVLSAYRWIGDLLKSLLEFATNALRLDKVLQVFENIMNLFQAPSQRPT